MMLDKLKAFLVHFSVSALVLGGFFVLLFFFWYRDIFAVTDVSDPLLLLIGIDLLLGPLLTFLVYRKGKKTLTFDLSVIVLMQLIAFVYGVYVIYQGKPSLMVDYNGRFELVFEKEIPDNKKEELQTSGLFSRPQYATIDANKVNVGLPVYKNLEYLQPLPTDFWLRLENENRAMPLESVLTFVGVEKSELLATVHGKGYKPEEVNFYFLIKDDLMYILAVDKSDHQPLFVLSQLQRRG